MNLLSLTHRDASAFYQISKNGAKAVKNVYLFIDKMYKKPKNITIFILCTL